MDRIWAGDASFWRPEAVARKQIESSLGWLAVPERVGAAADEMTALAREAAADAERVLVLASGAPAFAARLFAAAFPPAEGFPSLSVLDTTEPAAVAAAAAACDPARTLCVVASRTGAILETDLLFDFFFDRAQRALGDAAGRRFLVATEAGSALESTAAKRNVRAVVHAEPRCPGAFGSLTSLALLPLALLGADVAAFAAGILRMAEACRAAGLENPGLALGAAIGSEALAGRDKLTVSAGPGVAAIARWIEGLVAGALCREGRGVAPVAGEPLGGPAEYGSDRFFVRCEGADAEEPDVDQRLATLVEHGHPLAGFVVREPAELGGELFRWQFAAAVAARLLGVNPFDESDARDARDRASRRLAGAAGEPEAAEDGPSALRRLLETLGPGGLFAVSAWLPERPETAAAIERLRLAVRAAKKVATTGGFAPSFERASGQAHQAGPDGVLLQLVGPPGSPLPIPGRPWDFGRVLSAQADGDLEALRARGRRAARIKLGSDPAAEIGALAAAVSSEVAA